MEAHFITNFTHNDSSVIFFDKEQAVEDYKMAAELYKQLGKTTDYERVMDHLQGLQLKELKLN